MCAKVLKISRTSRVIFAFFLAFAIAAIFLFAYMNWASSVSSQTTQSKFLAVTQGDFSISYRPISVVEALQVESEPEVEKKYAVEDLLAASKSADAEYDLGHNYLESIVRKWESRAGIEPAETQFQSREGTSIDRSAKLAAYFGLLHAHTSDSDGEGSPDDAFSMARDQAKLDFFAVTDHSDFWKFIKKDAWENLKQSVKRHTVEGRFVALRGFEYSSLLLGHAVVLNSETFRSTYDDIRFQDFYEWLSREENKDAKVIFAHPGFHRYRKSVDLAHFEFYPEVSRRIVGLEAMHMAVYGHFQKGFSKQIPYLDEAIQKGWWLGPIASQDNHNASWGLQDTSRVALLLPTLTEEAILNALTERRFYLTSNENLQFAVNVKNRSGNWFPMGSRLLNTDFNKVAPVKVYFADADGDHPPRRIEIVVNGKIVASKPLEFETRVSNKIEKFLFWNVRDAVSVRTKATAPIAGEFSFDLPLNVEEDVYFYVRFYQGHRLVTQSSPIEFSRSLKW